ncbi:hypothetical protein CXB51_000789 [Gossypium anomalum]|uniref:DUF4283 domain-containing protein n=1 Tax=Gossypium anomalum TaxID=47600 RepID=A0A8J6DD04_9ROSI|nr:hypothetical protein CXB51_000789 [Gossypium anomalum]
MLIDSEPTTIVSWKNMLLGNFVEFTKEFGEKDGEIFYFIEGDFTKSSVKGIPTIAFSKQGLKFVAALKTIPTYRCGKWSVVMAWIRLPGLPKYLYNKKILEEIGGLIGKVAKLDFNTSNGLRGQFARMVIFVNLDKPLTSKILINGNLQRIVYESLSSICFSCGRYGHVKDLFPISTSDKDLTGENERAKRGRIDSWSYGGRHG